MADETEHDGLPAPSTFVRFLVGVAMRLLGLYLLAIWRNSRRDGAGRTR